MSGKREEVDKKDKPIEDGFTNALWNVLKPYTIGGKGIMGAASYVAVEVIVAQAIRRVMRAPYNVAESIETHAYSVPFLGSMNFGEPYGPYPESSSAKIDFTDQLTDGGKAIPAAIVGFTAMKLRREGIKVPAYANRDFLYMLIGKLLSRPLLQYIYSSLPEDVQIGLEVIQQLANRVRAQAKDDKAQQKAAEDARTIARAREKSY